MNINTTFPSKYIKSAEVPEDGITLTIQRVTQEDVDGKGTIKPIVYFANAKKGLVLNVTNAKKIATVLGTSETDEWAGQPITLYQSETEYAGETVPCIRVKLPAKKVKAKPAPPTPAQELTDDDIPF